MVADMAADKEVDKVADIVADKRKLADHQCVVPHGGRQGGR